MYNRQLAASVVEAYEGALAFLASTTFGPSLDVMGDLLALFKKRKVRHCWQFLCCFSNNTLAQSIIEVVKSSDKKSKLGQTPSLWSIRSIDKLIRLMLTEDDPAQKVLPKPPHCSAGLHVQF